MWKKNLKSGHMIHSGKKRENMLLFAMQVLFDAHVKQPIRINHSVHFCDVSAISIAFDVCEIRDCDKMGSRWLNIFDCVSYSMCFNHMFQFFPCIQAKWRHIRQDTISPSKIAISATIRNSLSSLR